MPMLAVKAELDPGFSPLSLAWKAYQQQVAAIGAPRRFVCAIERNSGYTSPWSADILPEGVDEQATVALLERIVKSLLWMRGGYKIHIAGCKALYERLHADYQLNGKRAFDVGFMQEVYEQPFEVHWHDDVEAIAQPHEEISATGRHLNGCRIGFDAGGSDRKVSAVIDGEAVYSEEVVWFPKITEDPEYHRQGILSAMKAAAAHMPRVDAIGVSSAGVYIDNRVRVASLFLKVPSELVESKVRNIYVGIARELGNIPLVVANDGDVTALAGAMNLDAGNVMGVAMGTSEAGGYVDANMHLMGWLNELAFVPVDANTDAMVDEWSGDYGCGVKYFSQDAVIKLAPAAGITIDPSLSPAEKLKVVQGKMEAGHAGARQIYETIGVYFGHAIAYYALFYTIEHVLIMGRVTSGEGGSLLLAKTREVLDREYPELAKHIQLHIPDENSRRVGQSVAAASLPDIH